LNKNSIGGLSTKTEAILIRSQCKRTLKKFSKVGLIRTGKGKGAKVKKKKKWKDMINSQCMEISQEIQSLL
jgi:hypothetical protein